MKYDKVSRRLFLTGVGGATLTLPFLSSLLPRHLAKAQAGAAPKRFIAVKSYSTQVIRSWYPTWAPGGYSVRPYGGGKDDGTTVLTRALAESSGRHSDGSRYTGTWAPLNDLAAQGVSRVIGTEFNPYLDKMLLLRGLDVTAEINHNDGGMLGNFGNGLALPGNPQKNVTIDQVLARSSKFYSSPPAGPRILHLSAGRANTISFAPTNPNDVLATGDGAIQQVQAHVDPRTAFDEAFRDFMPSGDSAPEVDPNKHLVDRVFEDYRALRDGSRIGAEDRQTLEQHMSFLSELQMRLDGFGGGGPTAACGEPTAPPSSTVGGTRDTDVAAIAQTYELFIDVLVGAIMCDVTRIVTLDAFKAVGIQGGASQGFFHSCDPCALSGPTNWHTHAHNWANTTSREIVVTINEWIARNVVLPIIDRLDQVTEEGGNTVLDNSIVFWGNELGFNHMAYTIPSLLAGSAGGALNTGRYIDYIDWNRPVRFRQQDGLVIEGVPYNRLLVALLQAYGLQPNDYETSPGSGFGESRILGKSASTHAVDYDMSQIAHPLPDIF